MDKRVDTKMETTTDKQLIVGESDLTLDQIVGQDEAISQLRELIDAIKYNEIYGKWNNPIPKGYLLIGPTGVGKTASVRALARELADEIHLFELKYSDVESKFIGAQVEALRKFFDLVELKAKERHVVLFVDEIDSMIPSRGASHIQERTIERINLWLEWLDGGFKSLENVTILGATNKSENMDTAVIRSGRFDLKIKYRDLTVDSIIKGIKIYTDRRCFSKEQIEDIDYSAIKIEIKEGELTGADLPELLNRVVRSKVTDHISNLRKSGYMECGIRKKKKMIADMEYFPRPITTQDMIRAIVDIREENNKSPQNNFGFTTETALSSL